MEWNNQFAVLSINLADKKDEAGYFQDAIKLVLNFLFNELNIHSVAVLSISLDQDEIIGEYLQAGFSIDVRMHAAQYRNGKYVDEFCLGLIRSEWEDRSKKNGRL